MSSGFSKSDLDSFFETDGVGIVARIVLNPTPLTIRSINVIFSADTQEVPIYSDTKVAASEPSFVCKSTDLVGVTARMQVTFPGLEPHEDGYGKVYETTARVISEGPQARRLYLKETS